MGSLDQPIGVNADDAGLTAERAEGRDRGNGMAEIAKSLARRLAQALLDLQAIGPDRRTCAEQEARRRQGGERVQSVVDQQAEKEAQRLRLAIRPLRAIGEAWPALLQRKAGLSV